MAKLTFIVLMNVCIGALLWLGGISPIAVQLFSSIASSVGTNVNSPIGNLSYPNQTYAIPQMTESNFAWTIITSPGFMFGILATLLVASAAGVVSYITGSNFSLMYIIPAFLITGFLFFFLSPITSVSMIIASDPNVGALGVIMYVIFLTITILGVTEWIRGYEM